ncbi:MAG: redoxin domain-containing protein [Oscillospiraceae bacterium]|nr:redoxin domain-containing protein [Oscillospiraceae bacterium]
MKRLKSALSLLLCCAMLFALAACGQDESPAATSPTAAETTAEPTSEPTAPTTEPTPPTTEPTTEPTLPSTAPTTEPTRPSTEPTQPPCPATETYTVTVRSAGRMALSGVDVVIYADEALTNPVEAGQTDQQGMLLLELPADQTFYISLSGLPTGYDVAPSYTFSGTVADITLSSSLIPGTSLSGVTLGLGDVMYDFTVSTPDGTSVTLSQLLKDKQMVLLNFWFSTCGPCANEFPYLQQAAQTYADKAAVLALDPLEVSGTVATYQQSMGLSIPMAACPADWAYAFNINNYPTSVVIDRYGVICLIEVGALTSLRPFTAIFEHFTAENYEQTLFTSLSELITTVKPHYAMDSSEAVSQILDGGRYGITYRPETEGESAQWSWPFIKTEKNGEICLKASNQEIEDSFAILYADVELQAGQAVGFDYLTSTEKGCDVLYIIVDDQDVYRISGYDEVERWQTCYPWVAIRDGIHEIAFCYLKDSDGNVGDDTVYLKNLRIIDAESIDSPTYIPRFPALSEDGIHYTYETIVLNEADGYYHVGSKDGPLLLADLMGYTQFNEEKTVWELVYQGSATMDGHNFYENMVNYFSYASNSSMGGVCTVNGELAAYLKAVADSVGFLEDEYEWLKICRYYEIYGTDTHLSDPIKGLANFSAYEARLGSDNYFYYDRPIMPRGLLAKFVPEKSGVYRITSHSDSENGVEGWIFGEDRNSGHYTYQADQRIDTDGLNVYMLYYMEAGQAYYIDIAFWDLYEVGTINYDIAYVAEQYDVLRLASPGFFTYDTNATGDAMYHLIPGGIQAVLGEDGYYYHDLGDGTLGSMLYADFTGLTPIFSQPVVSATIYDANGTPQVIKGLIELGGFRFENADYTEEINTYVEKMITDGPEELLGCVPVDARLAELLQMLMDRYTFQVEGSWTKMCYYYDHLGPEN